MKIKFLPVLITAFLPISNLVFAYGHSRVISSGGTDFNSGYSSSGTTISSRAFYPYHNGHFSISVNLPRQSYISDNTYFVEPHHHRHVDHSVRWIEMTEEDALPEDAVLGGSQRSAFNTPYFICRAHYQGGLHPGKLMDGRCHISWGGEEVSFSQYQVLTSQIELDWRSANFGYIPDQAVSGGYEHGHPLYICQTEYRGHILPGKVIGRKCNVSWEGNEISIPYYRVLVS